MSHKMIVPWKNALAEVEDSDSVDTTAEISQTYKMGFHTKLLHQLMFSASCSKKIEYNLEKGKPGSKY